MSVKPYVLSLTGEAFALATPPDGTITSGVIGPVLGALRWPSDLAPIRAQLATIAVAGPVDLVVVLEDTDADPEITAAAVASELFGIAAVRGVVVVSREEVRAVLAQVRPDIKADNTGEMIEAVNTLVGGEFSAKHEREAWAVAVLAAGTNVPTRTTPMLNLTSAYPSRRHISASIDPTVSPTSPRVSPTATTTSRDTALEVSPRKRTRKVQQPTAATSPVLSVAEVAGMLGVSVVTVRRLVEAGELVATRVGRQVRVQRADLDAYLARGRTTTADDRAVGARSRLASVRRIGIVVDEEREGLELARKFGFRRGGRQKEWPGSDSQ